MIRIILAALLACGAAQAEPTLRAEGVTFWQQDAPWFGGWSGIEITDAGRRMTVINDRGQLLEAQLRRAEGQITGIAILNRTWVGGTGGKRLPKKASDAEGMAIGQDGRAYISFEHDHRIAQTDLQSGRTLKRIDLDFAPKLGKNTGVEALAIGPDGTLFALAEEAPRGGAAFPLYAYSGGKWRVAAQIPQRGSFLPVGADMDAEGRLWLLERTVTPLGFRSRIRLIVLDPVAPREHVLLTTTPSRYDNLEGLSVWQDANRQTRLSMISDDNFLSLQRTQIVEYRVLE